MKYLKLYEERIYKYKKGDYVIPIGDNKKNSYTIIANVTNTSMPYMLHTFSLLDGKQLEQFPVTEDEILKKTTLKEITAKYKAKGYNL